MSQPLVSMCVPVYNHAAFVRECINSIIAQTYENIELIIIDDGSQDCSVAIVNELIAACEKRFTRFKFVSRPNKGVTRTLNEALEWAEGFYFCGLASDDKILPEKTECLVAHLENNPDCAAVFGSMYLIDEFGKRQGERCRKATYRFNDVFLLRAELPAPASLVRLADIKVLGGYNINTRIEDFDMWLKMTHETDRYLQVLPALLAEYRIHPANTWKQVESMYQEQSKILQSYKQHRCYDQAESALNCSRFRNLAAIDKKGALRCIPSLVLDYRSYFEPRLYQGLLHLIFRW